MMKEGFFCDVLGWLQLFQFSFVISYVILRNVLFAYLILFSNFSKEFGWVLFFDFVRWDLTYQLKLFCMFT